MGVLSFFTTHRGVRVRSWLEQMCVADISPREFFPQERIARADHLAVIDHVTSREEIQFPQ